MVTPRLHIRLVREEKAGYPPPRALTLAEERRGGGALSAAPWVMLASSGCATASSWVRAAVLPPHTLCPPRPTRAPDSPELPPHQLPPPCTAGLGVLGHCHGAWPPPGSSDFTVLRLVRAPRAHPQERTARISRQLPTRPLADLLSTRRRWPCCAARGAGRRSPLRTRRPGRPRA